MKRSKLVKHTQCRPRWRIVSMLLPLCFLAVMQPGNAMEKGEYPAPALDKFQPAGESEADVDADGVNDSLIRRYTSEAGESVFSLSTGDRLWAWSIAVPDAGGQLDQTQSYLIRDSNCDGVFDQKYATDEDFELPACLK